MDEYRYVIYARKSSESEERQVASIGSQIDCLQTQFPHLKVVDIITESKSAFKPENREGLQKLIQMLREGKADGILCWHPDRLSRNAMEAGSIIQLVNDGVIKSLMFANYTFINTPEGIMMLQMALSQSQYYSAKLSTDVKRGMENKRKQGWFPHQAPAGYLNTKEEQTGASIIGIDPVRFPQIKRAWDLMLTGRFSLHAILDILNDDMGFRTRKRKMIGGKKMNPSTLSIIFKNPFYAGYIKKPNGELIPAKHKPMISLYEFERVQEIMAERLNGQQNRRYEIDLPYKPLFRCGNCTGTITGERKQKQLSDGSINNYTYYHCTHKIKEANCKEGSVTESYIEEVLHNQLKGLMLHPILKAWGKHRLNSIICDHKETQKEIDSSKQKTIDSLLDQKNALTRKFGLDLITSEDYKRACEDIQNEILELNKKPTEDEAQMMKDKKTRRFIDLITSGESILKTGLSDQKRELIELISSNRTIRDRKVLIEPKKWVIEIEKFKMAYGDEISRFEPELSQSVTSLDGRMKVVCSKWWHIVDSVRNDI